MTKQVIGLGTTANDHAGDSLRVAGTKINANFAEIYAAIGNGTLPTLAVVAKTGQYADLSGRPPTAPSLVAPPTSLTATGTTGQISWDATNLYVCTNTNTWKAIPLNSTLGGSVGGYATVASSGSYNDLLDKPNLFSGSYTDLANKPSLFSGSYADLTNKPSLFSGSYTDLTNKPSLFSGSYNDLTDKPTIPASLDDLSDVQLGDMSQVPSGYVLKWDGSTWAPAVDVASGGGGVDADTLDGQHGSYYLNYNNLTNKPSLFSGSYTDLTNKPSLFSGSYNDLTDKPSLFSGSYTDLTDKPTIPSLSGYATESYVTTQITSLINGAPGTLDTLKEIADQLAADESAVSALTSTVASKIGLTNLSVSTASASGSGSLSYNNTSGVFTFTPAVGYTLPTSSTSVLGGVKVDGTTITINGSGVISTGYTQNQNLSSTSNVTFNNVTTTGQIIEAFQTYSTSISSGSTATLNCTNGNLWNITSTVSGNWTAALTNIAIATGQASSATLIINQGATAYLPTALSVNGTSVTINWQGGSTPTGNNGKKDIVSFSVLQTGASTYLVFGQLVTFG